MARLNEPPIAPQPSAETIDAVKRRFLRQNRELAKTNSQQSIRIRSLENDCSRLLAENLSLREQVVNLHATAESRPALDQIDAVRTQLEAKLQEIEGIVAGLAQSKKAHHGDRRKSKALARRRSGEERQFRSGLGLQEVENGMLPTITEDKRYPRRTMGAEELHEVVQDPDCSQSPDIGPPPVSRLEHEEPFDFDPSPDMAEQPRANVGEDEPALSVNLETRKKRRESGPKLSTRRVSLFESPEDSDETATKSTRTGSKRKFSVQQDEDAQAKEDPFRFSRRSNATASELEISKEESRPSSPDRPVLSAKPVNTDPVISPKKQRPSVQDKPEKPEKNLQALSKPRGRARLNITRNNLQTHLPPLPMPEPAILTADIILDTLPPKTPAVEDLFSPPSTEPSTQRPESKDTPPPGDLSSIDQTGQAGRPGRRARPQVSYKEPSLNTKMRRPDAKLVDAIVERRTSAEPHIAPPSTVKREGSEDLGWKLVSAVTGRVVEEEAEVGSPLRQKLDRKETGHDTKISPSSIFTAEQSTTSKAISALITETSTAKRKPAASGPVTTILESIAVASGDRPAPKKEPMVKQEPQDKDNLAVFDFAESSPADSAPNPRTRISELAKASRNARRHSAMPAPTTEDRKVEKTEGALPSLHKRTGSGSVKSSSTSNLTKSTSVTTKSSFKEKKPLGTGLPTSSSSIDLKAKMDSTAPAAHDTEKARETTALRAERAASRRKSMML